MSTYIAPVRDMRFVLNELAGLEEITGLPGFEETDTELVEAILDEAGKFAAEVIDPINAKGDRQGAVCKDGEVTTSPGYKEAFQLFCETGWHAMPASPEYGGQGLPHLVTMAVSEMWKSASIAFGLCPMLTNGAVEAIAHHGSDALKAKYLPNMVAGVWTGTMNLTEPQAGSDLAAIRSKAVPQADGTYRISGTKIFITWGEHDVAENIIHLVLARLPDAPPGVKGISLFLVPKFLVNDDGSLGARNDLVCASIEHKLGIHASPTAVMSFGEKDGAIGWLIGEANKGLAYMFTMMNHARLNIGMEGLSVSERAYQHALAYARERVQGAPIGDRSGQVKPILHHPDVRRMLMDMKSRTEAMRALSYWVAGHMDLASHHPDAAQQARSQAYVDLLTPVVKGWCTESAVEITSTGIQIHGGVGFVEETGAAQYFRDARITPIYEGTTAIQANDLIGRKIAREGGLTAKALVAEMRKVEAQLAEASGDEFAAIRKSLSAGVTAVEEAVEYIVATYGKDIKAASVGSVPFLKLLGIVAGGWQMARAALVSARRLAEGSGDASFYKTKITTARFYADHVLSQAPGLAYTVVNGAAGALDLTEDQF